MKRALFASVAAMLAATAARAAPAPPAPLQHRLEVRLEPESSSLFVTDRIHLRSSAPIIFTLAPELTVDRLLVDGKPVPAAPTAGRWTLHLDAHPEHDVTVDYHGRLPGQGGGEGGTDLVVGTSGTFLAGGGWYPTFADGPLSYDISVHVPHGQVAVAPGKILSEETTDDGYHARFASEWPADDISLFAGPYQVTEKIHRGRRLRTYFAPEVADLAALYLDKVAGYLDLYEGWIGAYPYSFFDVVSGPLPVGLGFPGPHLHRRQRPAPSVSAGDVARPRGAAQLVGQRGLHRRERRQLGGGADDLHGRLHLRGAKGSGRRARHAPALAARVRGAAARRRPAADGVPQPRPHRLAGGRVSQGGDGLPHAARPHRQRRVRRRGAPLLEGAALPLRHLERPEARLRSRVRRLDWTSSSASGWSARARRRCRSRTPR